MTKLCSTKIQSRFEKMHVEVGHTQTRTKIKMGLRKKNEGDDDVDNVRHGISIKNKTIYK